MIRNHLKGDKMVSKSGFRYRGVSASRLEGITDAVFGFAITLLVISLEVPKTYLELQVSMYSFLGFVLCTVLILLLWNDHYEFFLRYGLEDATTKTLNFFFLFLILFYVYPLKYLFDIFGTFIWLKIKLALGDNSEAIQIKIQEFKQMNLSTDQWGDLMIRYGGGLIMIYLVFLFLYWNALKKKNELELNEMEVYETKVKLFSYPVMLMIPISSVLIVLIGGNAAAGYAGMVYSLFGLVIPLYYKVVEKYKPNITSIHE